MDFEKELSKQLLGESDNPDFKRSYNQEIEYYDVISHGDIEKLLKMQEYIFNDTSVNLKQGTLSQNEINNLRYHAIILTAMASRFCIEAGLDISVSYAMSDIFIRQLDQAKTAAEIRSLTLEIPRKYCLKMRDLVKKDVVSRHIVLAIDYIRSHIQENLTIDTIAYDLSLNSSYLSKLFKQEMGVTISQYIRKQKIEIAESMLRHLDESSLDIANYLGFSSQSHFIQVFKKEVGMTPEEYRKRHYHQSWMNGDQN